MKKGFLILAILILGAGAAFAYFKLFPTAPLPALNYQTKTETKTTLEAGTLKQKNYLFPNGGLYWQGQAVFSQTQEQTAVLWQRNYAGKQAYLRYYDPNQQKWVVQANPSGILPAQTLFLTIVGPQRNISLIISQPMAYAVRENSSLEYFAVNNGQVRLNPTGNGFALTIQAQPQAERQIEYWVLQTPQAWLDWENPELLELWPVCLLNDDHRFNYDGYYYTSAHNYQPSGENYYYRMPSPYVVHKYLTEFNTNATDLLALAMLDIMRPLQNAAGYFPTAPSSEWLFTDYGIGTNFFDTRFSTEAAQAYLAAYQKFGLPEFLESSLKYGEFFLNYASEHHFRVLGTTLEQEGWLIEDYWSPQAASASHSSLNHQLNEIRYLYDLAAETSSPDYQELANKLLLGIKLSCKNWIQADDNLVYGFLSHGEKVGTDYPYLTYNDLFRLQKTLEKYQGRRDPDLQTLMDHKLLWMQRKQVVGYYTE